MKAYTRGKTLSKSVKDDIAAEFLKWIDSYKSDYRNLPIPSRKCKNTKKKDMNLRMKIPRGYAKCNSKDGIDVEKILKGGNNDGN